jgi:hypothetical protein
MAHFMTVSKSEDVQHRKLGSSEEKELEDTWKGDVFA